MTALPKCTNASHAALVADNQTWQALPFNAIWAMSDDYALEMRDCPACRSTLSREIDPRLLERARANGLAWTFTSDARDIVIVCWFHNGKPRTEYADVSRFDDGSVELAWHSMPVGLNNLDLRELETNVAQVLRGEAQTQRWFVKEAA